MKTTIASLQNSFESWYEVNEKSRIECNLVLDMYHNRQWAPEQVRELEGRGQPTETFNIIKLMTRTLVGYYSTVVNKAVVEPKQYNDITKATMLNDVMKTAYEQTDFDLTDDDIKMYGFLAGFFISHTTVNPTGEKDMFGRNEQAVDISDVSPDTAVLDPLSKKRDYSDARGIHTFKWMDEEEVKLEFRKKQTTIDKLESYANHLNVNESEFTHQYDTEFVGKYKVDNMYLVVHSVIKNDKGQFESVFWCGDVELARTTIDFKKGLQPYTVTKLMKSNKEEYYGIFHEVIEPQKAVNQALVQIQLLINTSKAIVEDGAVDDIDEFADSFARVNSVSVVEDLNGIKIEQLTQSVLEQYTIIDKAYMRIKAVLGVNDAMLGDAYSADSGRKVKLQKNTGIMTLRYLTGPLELFHKKQATLVATLIGQYYTAHQVMRVTDDITGNRFVEINMPMMLPKLPPELANLVAQGMPVEFAFQAMMTGQLSPQVQQAMQADQQAQMANQEYQQAQQQAMMATQQQQQQLVMEGLSPQNLQPVQPMMPPPPSANNVATLKAPELSKEVENSKKSKMNSLMATERPNAPEGLQYMYEEMINPETGLPETDKEGRILLTPVSQPETMIEIESFDITIKPSSYDDEDEKAQLMMEVLLNGPAGIFAQNASPASYAKMVSLNVQSMKTKYSPEIAQMFNEMAMAMGQNPEFEAYMRTVASPPSGGAGQNGQGGSMTPDGNGGSLPSGGMGGGGSTTGKLPQNTNEGVG